MSRKKKNQSEEKDEKDEKAAGADPEVHVHERDEKKAAYRTFPGPRGAKATLRVAMDKQAYANITAHAAGSLDAEICGILAGTQCEDDDGPFLQVDAAVRGDTARRGSTHVTFTHETWDVIHQTMEKEHPKLEIVGWYHSHPGFGVEFSEMDIFIQKNFFKPRTQVAMVVDPLGGHTAMCVDTPDGICYIDRFWVDSREQKCKTPRRADSPAVSAESGSDKENAAEDDSLGDNAGVAELTKALKTVQERLAQTIQAVDEQRTWIYRTVLAFGMFICTGVILYIGWSIWRSYSAPLTPPEFLTSWSAPVMIEGKPVMLGVGIVKWQVPPELNAAYVQIEKQRLAAEAAAAATQPAPDQPAPSASGPQPAPNAPAPQPAPPASAPSR